ncbi:MAG: hypothetical protein C4345_09715, partial [Chloroflexota bacterium]
MQLSPVLPGQDEQRGGEGEPEEEEAEQPQNQDQEKEQKQKEDEVDWEEILLNGFDVGGPREQFEVQEYTEPVTVETRNLADHL